MEQLLKRTSFVLNEIKVNHNIGESDLEYYTDTVDDFIRYKKELKDFLQDPQKSNVKKNKRDILWTLVFAYRDICGTFYTFDCRIKDLIKDISVDRE